MIDSASTIQVFVYGTLKPRESNYLVFCQGNTIAEIAAYTRGKIYQLSRGYPGMSKGDRKIKGYLLVFAAESNMLASLDKLENYQENREEELNDYHRQIVTVYDLQDHKIGDAWCYLMTPTKIKDLGGKLMSSNIWNGCN